MTKYWLVFKTSWQGAFEYRFAILLWRFRNVLRFLLVYFLWTGIFTSNQEVFGYQEPQILTYIFLALIVQAWVMSSASNENMGGEIANGNLSNYLTRPISYLGYWFSRDISDKLLNLGLSAVEIGVLWLWLRPVIIFPSSLSTLAIVLGLLVLAVFINFCLSASARFIAFWTPENTWGLAFVLFIVTDILSGGMFPLDILPNWLLQIINLTPFPYLTYYPIAIYVGKVTGFEILKVIIMSVIWCGLSFAMMRFIWKRGLKVYSAVGK